MLNDEDKIRELISKHRSEQKEEKWSGTCGDYLRLVKANPEIARLAPGRLYSMISRHGVAEVSENRKLPDYEDMVEYNFFAKNIFGAREPLHDIMRFFRAGSRRTEIGKRILILVGPVSSGKSTIAAMLKRGLEEDTIPIYCISDCPIHEDPLHLVPRKLRPALEKELGVKIEGDLCPMCRFNLKEKFKDGAKVLWENVPVAQFFISERARRGVGSFQPSDPKNQDINELIGHVDLSKITLYGETDPRAFKLDGELEIANRGLIEYVEILKCDIKFHYVLITVAQEQVIKAPGFPQVYTDLVILSHTNQTEFDKFKSQKENEALHDRMYPIFVPYNVEVFDEERIYRKLLNASEFHGLHFDPWALTVAAQFAVLTRLTDSELCPSKVSKMRYYNHEKVVETEKDPVDVKKLREQGKKNGEGLSGISPRFVANALFKAAGAKEPKGYVTAIDVVRELRANFAHHIGFSEEEKARYLNLLTGEKESVIAVFKDEAKKVVFRAFLVAYEDQAQALFDNYMKEVTAFCRKKKVKDPLTGDERESDEKLMQSIEEQIGITENSKKEFRQGIFVFKAESLEQGRPFAFDSYRPLQEAIEKKLVGDLKNVVSMSIADKDKHAHPKSQKRREDAVKALMDHGYSEGGAQELLEFVGDLMRKEE